MASARIELLVADDLNTDFVDASQQVHQVPTKVVECDDVAAEITRYFKRSFSSGE